MARRELLASDIIAIQDSREQNPFVLPSLKTEIGTLTTGDYSIKGLENVIACERKSLEDLLMCVGTERERFDREMLRILAYPHKLLIIEATWLDIESGIWRPRVTAAAVRGSLLAWMAQGIPIFFGRDHKTAAGIAAHWLFLAARRRWRECVALCDGLKLVTKEKDDVCGSDAT